MPYFIGLDVSIETTAICVLTGEGEIACEASIGTSAAEIAAILCPYEGSVEGIGLEAGPMSEWLVHGLEEQGLQAVLMETRRVHAALSAMPVKTDRKDARGIAELLRMGWFRSVHMKTSHARDLRILLSARESLGRRMRDLDNSIRGLLRGFGLRLPTGLRGRIGEWARELIEENPTLNAAIKPLIVAREALSDQLYDLDKRLRTRARHDRICQRLMTVPGVGEATT